MRCPFCASDDTRVADSRDAEGGAAIRRRRHCPSCDRRFTTYERADVTLVVVKRDGTREPFDRAKAQSGVAKACAGRSIADLEVLSVIDGVEEALRTDGPQVTTEQVGREILVRLRDLDEVAYLRFASVYKGFENVAAFQREINHLVKARPPKTRKRRASEGAKESRT